MSFDAELALDRLEAELATELPGHMRAFARAYADGALPSAPAVMRRRGSLDLVLRALEDEALAVRSLPLIRLLAPLAIEDDAAVTAARENPLRALGRGDAAPTTASSTHAGATGDSTTAGSTTARSTTAGSAPAGSATAGSTIAGATTAGATTAGSTMTSPSWPAWAQLAAARDVASTRQFQRAHVPFLHWLHGTGWTTPTSVDWPSHLDGWHDPAPPIPSAFVERAWRDLADRHGVRGICRIVHSPTARPRAFLVESGREVIVVIGALATPAARFAALHELGHAVAGLLSPVVLPRMLDEAAASYIARLVEREGDLDLPWFTPIAAAARERRMAISMALDAYERGVPPKIAKPPWALWNDPGAQAAYFVAERFADRWWAELGAAPAPGAFARTLTAARDQVDRAALADRTLVRPMQPA